MNKKEKVSKHRMKEEKPFTQNEKAIGFAFMLRRKIAILEIHHLMRDYNIDLADLRKNGEE